MSIYLLHLGEQIGVLGMKDVNTIKDCQITVSDVANPNSRPQDIRRIVGSGWMPAIRSEPFQKYTGITITFGRLTTVYYLMTSVIGTDKLRLLDIYSTLDGHVYHFIEQVNILLHRPAFCFQNLGPSVSQVLSYSPSKNLLFGLGPERNQQSLLLSTDMGKRWVSVNQFAYTVLLEHVVDLVNATAVPWTVIDGQFDSNTKGVQCVAYTAGPFQKQYSVKRLLYHILNCLSLFISPVCYDGIYYNGTLVVDWNSACPTLPDL
ncbi:hypothetical protein P879_07771 [Paragonimus westermani]|uniref:Uncharacterized protein n=1 Tax=Paragonimus westermani TaxID=34504 RepID=A0A8T0D3R9_9TREM|nr:hypothetical protein P879_07771 [Paragonimus westermani]